MITPFRLLTLPMDADANPIMLLTSIASNERNVIHC